MSVELPPYIANATRHLPLFPLQRFLQKAANKSLDRHREKLDRLAPYLGCRFAVNPTDLDWLAVLVFQEEGVKLSLTRQAISAAQAEVRISAPILVLLELLEGEGDGDAHFFSRDLVIEGDTEAILALRNTLDNAEVDFLTEVTELFGPLARPLRFCLGQVSRALKNQPNRKVSPTAAWPASDENSGLYPS
jgi:predicted lipid carrier protein YhbT|tara:strand:+ start:3124 stop:3696 length:573 start_codon:yes stop_codon:yes gene_type:complete